jgi:hypothetical protein
MLPVERVLLTAIYYMLRDGTFYQDLGADHFQKDTPYAQAKKLADEIDIRLGRPGPVWCRG